MNDFEIFREVQYFPRWLYWLLWLSLGPGCLMLVYGIYQQMVLHKPFGDTPASDMGLILIFIIELGMLVLFIQMRLTTVVTDQGLFVQMHPFHLRPVNIKLFGLKAADVITYNALNDFGGWGIRYGTGGKIYNAQGNRAVRLSYGSGTPLLLGSQKPEELLAAIQQLLKSGVQIG
ncbi:MAG: DUF6141 family protein [Armatimonadota bacterium]